MGKPGEHEGSTIRVRPYFLGIAALGTFISGLLLMTDVRDLTRYALLWGLGLVGLGIMVWNLEKRIALNKRYEESLLRSEIKFRRIVNTAQDAIVMLNPQGNISMWNDSARRIFGYEAEEALGKDMRKLLAPSCSSKAHLVDFDEFLRSGEGPVIGTVLELTALRKSGEEFPFEMALSCAHLGDGWHAIGIIRDITERKRSEQMLQETNRHLEEATARANDMAVMAEMANMAKSEFVANMSHELRTPMNGVMGMADLLLGTGLNKEQRRYVETIMTSADALLAIVNDILDFSKIEAGKLELESLDFDLRSLLDDFASIMAVEAAEKGLEFICAPDPEVPAFVRGDPGRLRQVLNNLVGNALKFTSQGEVAVRAFLKSETSDGAQLEFTVRDTGIGIPAGKIKNLFQKFMQVDSSTTRKFGGTGLGLAISKQLVKAMGGEIHVESREGKGSEFRFTVRLAKQPDKKREEMPLPADIRGTRVLVVDDNKTNREIIGAWLHSWRLRPMEKECGAAALDALRDAQQTGDPFPIAILDMRMPGMDGEALGDAIRSDDRLSGTKMIMMTSLGRRGDARRLEEIGFSAYLTKPVRQSELLECLSRVMAGGTAPPVRPPILTRHSLRELPRGNARILLAEDNLTNQQVTLGILRKLGLQADVVVNGLEVLEVLEQTHYDLILMDIQMPELDGLTATRAIRNPHSRILDHGIPIIAMTAHAQASDSEKCLEAGMNDYLSKPVRPEMLAAALKRWLPQEGESAAAPPSTLVETRSTSPSEPPVAAVFDKQALRKRLLDDEELAQVVVAGFLEDLPRQIETLKRFLDLKDLTGATRQVHSIKGAAATVGGMALSGISLEMEKAGKTGSLESVASLMPELENQFNRLRDAMSL